MIDYIYGCILSFLRLTPGKDYASGWSAAFVPLVFVNNIIAVIFTLEVVQDIKILMPGAKVIVGALVFVSSAWSYFHYEIARNGCSLRAYEKSDKTAIVGGIILVESLCVVLLPGIVAVLKGGAV